MIAVGLGLALFAIVRAVRMPHEKGSIGYVVWRLARWIVAAVLVASAIWISASPRAEQPLLDAAERAFPAIRAAYSDGKMRTADAREKNRWWIAGVMVLMALSLAVSLPSRRTTPRNFGGEGRSIGP